MALPRKLYGMKLSSENGHTYLGELGEVTLPKIGIETEEWMPGGSFMKYDLETGVSKMEAEFKMGGLVRTMLRQFGKSDLAGAGLRFVGTYQRDDGTPPMQVEAVMRGRYTEIDMGGAKSGDMTEHTYKMSVVYYKLICDGRVEYLCDPMNYEWVVDGVDLMADRRAALEI